VLLLPKANVIGRPVWRRYQSTELPTARVLRTKPFGVRQNRKLPYVRCDKAMFVIELGRSIVKVVPPAGRPRSRRIVIEAKQPLSRWQSSMLFENV